MIDLKGKYNQASVYTDNIEQEAISQIINLCNQEFMKDSKISIMPDVHAGKGCTIGTTMTIKDKVVPNLVGVDIGCGMECAKLKNKDINFELLDNIIREYIPHGQNVRDEYHKNNSLIVIEDLICKHHINMDRAKKSLGTLGGGNHFIEVNQDDDNNIYLVVHSGSRYLGKQVAEYYQELAYKTLSSNEDEKQKLIDKLKAEGRQKDIQKELLKIPNIKINKDLAYLEGSNFDDYLHDMNIVQHYAMINRKTMIEEITSKMGLEIEESFSTIHNYIDVKNNILRKGAISAQLGEKVLIPINMRDGSIIAVGKGNSKWNYSAPHGAGRLMSRSKAKEQINLDEFKKSMDGIWSTSVVESTIDESPMAYKPMDEILENIKDTVEVKKIIKPIYNFKSN